MYFVLLASRGWRNIFVRRCGGDHSVLGQAGQGLCRPVSAQITVQSNPYSEGSFTLLTADGSSRCETGDTILMYHQILRANI